MSDEEMARRRSALRLLKISPNRGSRKLVHYHDVQAPGGVAFDFLEHVDRTAASRGALLCLWYVLNSKLCRGI